MKTLTTLVFALSLLALAPPAHAQMPNSNSGATCTPGSLTGCPTGYSCQATGGSSGICVQSGNVNSGTTNTGSSITLLNPLKAGTDLPTLLDEIIKFVIQIGTVIIILMIVYIGFKFVTAQGEPGKISEAREALMWTVVGALILLGAEAIAKAIEATALAL